VLFICYGNVCRSPYAAAVFAELWPPVMPHVTITSAGFVGPGRGSPEAALSAARRRGIDLTRHRSTLVSTQAVRGAELAIVMSATQSRALRRVGGRQSIPLILGDLDPEPILTRTIVDPWGEADEVFDESYERIDRCVRELVREMTSTSRQEANRE
jgi:protein-tyrosine phosphatase